MMVLIDRVTSVNQNHHYIKYCILYIYYIYFCKKYIIMYDNYLSFLVCQNMLWFVCLSVLFVEIMLQYLDK